MVIQRDRRLRALKQCHTVRTIMRIKFPVLFFTDHYLLSYSVNPHRRPVIGHIPVLIISANTWDYDRRSHYPAFFAQPLKLDGEGANHSMFHAT